MLKRRRLKKELGTVKSHLARDVKDPKFPLEEVRGKLPLLHTGDIILIRHKKGGIARKLLRRLTRSYWDHSALVIFPKNHKQGYA